MQKKLAANEEDRRCFKFEAIQKVNRDLADLVI